MTSAMTTWVLEPDVFSDESYRAMRDAVLAAGHEAIAWSDDGWSDGRWPRLADRRVIFHGSLGNAARIRATLPWRPGAWCDVAAFHCSAWYPRARPWLLHRAWELSTVEALVAAPAPSQPLFVRPDSPLKPFSGRVLAQITLKALDHGLYYDDAGLPVIVAPVRAVGREWRYVVVERRVVAGSAYDAQARAPSPDDPGGAPWQFAAAVARELEPPEAVYVMDVCEADGELHVLELNPFSGADLYGCARAAVVAEVSRVA